MPLPLTISDLAGFDDLDLFGSETQSDLETLAQDVYHVLIERPGSNIDDIDRGIGISALLSAPTTALTHITMLIESELAKDDRIDGVTATLTELPAGAKLPDGSALDAPGYLLEVDIVSGTDTLGLTYSFTPTGGLVAL